MDRVWPSLWSVGKPYVSGSIWEQRELNRQIHNYCGMYILLSDDKHQMVRDSSKNALARLDVIVTQLLRYHMPLLYFVCNHLML